MSLVTLELIAHIQFVGQIIIEVLSSALFGIVLDVLIKEDGLRGVLMRVDASLITNPVQIRSHLSKGCGVAAIAAIDAAK